MSNETKKISEKNSKQEKEIKAIHLYVLPRWLYSTKITLLYLQMKRHLPMWALLQVHTRIDEHIAPIYASTPAKKNC